uniref:tRNA(Ile)-lysidine synthase, chloroplastic n=1 Tax=Cosmarium botrytis TaxID=33101 RepID=A0A191T5G0_9VIRI|nr:tRNA(Ile)-lysidine synthetase [Cosmarium botrytis]ANI25638.1 tRNA(Ile)-lysidine synthetase [Cosmarium botrytis]
MDNDKEKKKFKNFYQSSEGRHRDISKKYTKTLPAPKNRPKEIYKIKKRDDLFLLYKINNIIKERTLLQPNQRILIAVSGGQDSICLLKILYYLKNKWNWKLGIIHCDHQWNSRSKFQAEHVACLAFNLQINYHEGITIHSVQKEGIARIWRYNIIQTIAISNNYSAIITGHNASDRIETLLYNLTRGSGLHGLQSIKWKRYLCFFRVTQSVLSKKKDSLRAFRVTPAKRLPKELPTFPPKVGPPAFLFKKLKYIKRFDCFSFFLNKKQLYLIRPLLESTRTEIRNVFNIWKLPSWPDLSNKELKIKRNRIRHRLIPYIRLHFNPNIDQTLVRWSEIVQSETFYLEELTNYLLSKIEIKKKIFLNSYATKISLLRTFGTSGKKQKQSWEQNFDFYQSAIPIALLRSLPLSIQRRLLKEYIYRNTSRILGFQYIEQIRLSCLLNTYLSTNIPISSPEGFSSENYFYLAKKYPSGTSVGKITKGPKAEGPEREGRRLGKEQEKNSKIVTPWILFPDGIKLVVRKNYIFLFYPLRKL